MKTLIICSSTHRGNTEKIGRAIADELNAEMIKPSELKDFDLKPYDLVGLGSGIYGGRHHASILELADKFENAENKRFFIFSTSGFKDNSKNSHDKLLIEKIIGKKGKIVSIFNCLGFTDSGPLKLFGGINKGRPNEEDIKKAKEFAEGLKPKVLTLCLTLKDREILLGMKKRGFGEGRWNGFGGKLEKGETIIEAAKREMLEESGLLIEEIEEMGYIDFHFMDTGKLMEVHMFDVIRYTGEPVETEEMRPQWFKLDEIPFENMWADDPYWFPLFLKKKKFKGRIIFKDNDIILSHELEILN
ncbi:MAG: NUDIX domain-containing protein [Candidatus Paceibacterota bacterium]|jgi:8-oxo-dGTP diphosphatase/2-hydroxy-dATP diphosphatase